MDTTVRELQCCELNILKAFIEVCEKNQLQYYLGGGTCLGAIRHKGFIPWDDDVDVALPREDYNRFLEIAQDELPDYYFLQTFITDEEYLGNFAKIRDSRTTFIEASTKNRRINHGVYIDIFPLDYYPEKNVMLFKLRERLYIARISSEYAPETVATASKATHVLQRITRLLMPDLKKAIRDRDKHIQSVKTGKYWTSFCGVYTKKEILAPECYGKGVDAEFEGINMKIPARYDEYLTYLYGDYMTPIPPAQQVGHHTADLIDLKKTYTEYTN